MGQSASNRITEGLKHITADVSCTPDEFRRDMQPDGAALLEAILNLGYAQMGRAPASRGRVGMTEAGRRRLVDADKPEAVEG